MPIYSNSFPVSRPESLKGRSTGKYSLSIAGHSFDTWVITRYAEGPYVKILQMNSQTVLDGTDWVNQNGTWTDGEVTAYPGKLHTAIIDSLTDNTNKFCFRQTGNSDPLLNDGAGTSGWIMNDDIAHQLGVADLSEFYGEPGNMYDDEYEGLRTIRNRYFQKYTKPNNFWDFMRLVLFFDTSLFKQIRTLLPARARSNVGLLIEEHMVARPKKKWSKPASETRNWRKTIDLTEVYTTTGSRDDYIGVLPFLSQSHILNGTSSMYYLWK